MLAESAALPRGGLVHRASPKLYSALNKEQTATQAPAGATHSKPRVRERCRRDGTLGSGIHIL